MKMYNHALEDMSR